LNDYVEIELEKQTTFYPESSKAMYCLESERNRVEEKGCLRMRNQSYAPFSSKEGPSS